MSRQERSLPEPQASERRMNTLTTNVAVVGAGPAGARVAELLSMHGARVLLLDPKAPWEKPCGGGLTESAFHDVPELRELEPGTRSVRDIRVEVDAAHGFTISLATPIRVVSRLALARWQLDRARAAGATHLPERVRSIRRTALSWRLETDARTIHADLLVGADGAASLVRRVAAPKFDVELAPTRVAYVPDAGPTPESIVLRFFPLVAGYVWDFPRPDHRSVGVGIQAGEWRRPRMDAAVDEFRRAAEECGCREDDIERAGAVIGTAQLGHGDFSRIRGEDFALLGDAAGLADPLSGEGIRNALRSAELLATAWTDDGTFSAYPALARRAFEREFHVSRILRRVVFESDTGTTLIEAAERSPSAHALVKTLADAINEHDGSLPSLLRRWWRARRAVQRDPTVARWGERLPVPCPCGCGGEEVTTVAGRSVAGVGPECAA